MLAKIFGAGSFHHVAQRLVQQCEIADGGAAAQVEAEVLRIGLTGYAGRGAAEALQMLVGVAQLNVDILLCREEFIVEHHSATQAVDIEPAAIEKVEVLACVLAQQPVADAQIACHSAQRDVADGAQYPVAAVTILMQMKIPADATRGGETVPSGGDSATLAAVAHHKFGIVAAKTQGPFQIDGHTLAHGGAAAHLGHVERRRCRCAGVAADVEVAGCDVGHHSEGHQRHHCVGTFLYQ